MNYSLKTWNTFGITKYANNIEYAKNTKKLLCIWKNAIRHNQPVLILGEGSNVLFLEDFFGTVIINRIMGITVNESNDFWHIHVGAGENWHELVLYTLKKNMPGLENLAFIPGCAGSSPIQNIGAYGVEFKQVCEYVDCVELTTGTFRRLSKKECRFGYRDSIFKQEYKKYVAIIAVGLRLNKVWKPILTYKGLTRLNSTEIIPKQIFNVIAYMRKIKLPNLKIYGNAGSFFKNPIVNRTNFRILLKYYPNISHHIQVDGNIKISAGWLIEKCKLKGMTYGGAAIYQHQSLILINRNTATSKDIIQLARLVRKRVGEKFDIWLEPEVRFIGCCGEVNATEVIS